MRLCVSQLRPTTPCNPLSHAPPQSPKPSTRGTKGQRKCTVTTSGHPGFHWRLEFVHLRERKRGHLYTYHSGQPIYQSVAPFWASRFTIVGYLIIRLHHWLIGCKKIWYEAAMVRRWWCYVGKTYWAGLVDPAVDSPWPSHPFSWPQAFDIKRHCASLIDLAMVRKTRLLHSYHLPEDY